MSITVITTSQAPDAKPIGASITLDTSWQTLVEVPSYEVPEETFGGGTVVVPGVAEIISPLIVCNRSTTTRTFSIRVYRESIDATYFLADTVAVPAKDTLFFPLNGQFFFAGDTLEITASATDVLDATLSYTVGQAEQNDVI
jgi:hypothetical protein